MQLNLAYFEFGLNLKKTLHLAVEGHRIFFCCCLVGLIYMYLPFTQRLDGCSRVYLDNKCVQNYHCNFDKSLIGLSYKCRPMTILYIERDSPKSGADVLANQANQPSPAQQQTKFADPLGLAFVVLPHVDLVYWSGLGLILVRAISTYTTT